jgi:hypothetical protein
MKAATLTRASRLSTCPFVFNGRILAIPFVFAVQLSDIKFLCLGKIVPGFWLTGNGKWYDRKRLYLFDIADGLLQSDAQEGYRL